MSEDNSRGFTKFLKSSADKLSSKKSVKFLPPQTTDKDAGSSESKAKSQKEHRRAQVRKAQIEHRQRKQNLITHLEQDVIRLRDMISKVDSDFMTLKQENTSIKTALSKSNIPITTVTITSFQPSQQTSSPSELFNFQSAPQNIMNANSGFQSSQQAKWPSNSSSSNVSITFDDFVEASCLQVSPSGSINNDTVLNSPEIFNFPTNTLSQLPQAAVLSNEGLQNSLPQLPGQSASASLSQPDISTIAVNFILALEHPCRTHFHALPSEFDPTEDPTGHELMASTLLYSHAPEFVFTNLDSASWTAPSLELTTLWEMSQSLPKGDFEITPVQAWFVLSQNYEAGRVLRNLEELKRGIGKLVGCFAFGAVMDELKFRGVVKDIMDV